MSSLGEATQRVVLAWTKPGVSPSTHFRMRDYVVSGWPSLARAVHDLVQAFSEPREERVEHLCQVMLDAQGHTVDWADVPEANKDTMRVAVAAMLEDLGL